jgi:ssDNA-binding Zn-finger/Zn-ribbon topoisomerase 1
MGVLTMTVGMQCTNPKCKSQWNTKADKENGKVYPADVECPDCGSEGIIVDYNVDSDLWADNQRDSDIEQAMMAERKPEYRRVA